MRDFFSCLFPRDIFLLGMGIPENADGLNVGIDCGEIRTKGFGNGCRRPALVKIEVKHLFELSGIKDAFQDIPQLAAFLPAQPHSFKPQDRPVNPCPGTGETDFKLFGQLSEGHTGSFGHEEQFVGLALFGGETGIFDIPP